MFCVVGELKDDEEIEVNSEEERSWNPQGDDEMDEEVSCCALV